MQITETYPRGGSNKMWEPLHLKVSGLNLPGITIIGRTWTRDGAEMAIFHNGEPMNTRRYDYHQHLGYESLMARDAAEDANFILEMHGIAGSVSSEDLLPVMKLVRAKCESRYGNRIPGEEYEVLVEFAE